PRPTPPPARPPASRRVRGGGRPAAHLPFPTQHKREGEMALAEAKPAPSEARQPILALKGIYKRFGAVEALRDVDLAVYPAEVVALVGDNGAGKSTLVKVIAGIGLPDEGAIEFEGH